MNVEHGIHLAAEQAVARLLNHGLVLTTAESCTGGWVAKAITDIPGTSAVLDRGFVTYTNASKHELLDVPEEILETHGAVSEATVRALAEGALQHSQAQTSLAVSGIAGPTGGTPDKPVGTVWFAWAIKARPTVAEVQHFTGERHNVRAQAVIHALNGIRV